MFKPPLHKSSVCRDIILEHSLHLKKLSRVSSRIDNSSPKKMTHVYKNSKGKYLEKTVKESILSTNKILVDKLLKVSSRENSTCKSRKNAVSQSRSRKNGEIFRITCENFRILNKIKTSRPYYSSEKMKKEYRFSSTLKKMISQNAGRVPRVMNFTQFEFNNDLAGARSSKNFAATTQYEF